MLLYVHGKRTDYLGRGAQDGHLDFHTSPELKFEFNVALRPETIRLIRGGENGGKGVWRWGKRESIYLSLHCHHQNDLH